MRQALAKRKTQWEEDLFFAVKLDQQNLSEYYPEVTITTGMKIISANILDLFRRSRSFRNWDKGMDHNPEDETFYTAKYQEALLKYLENEYCGKHRRVPVNQLQTVPNSTLIPSAMALGSYQSSFDPDDLSSNDEEYLMGDNVPETTPGRSDRVARILTAARLILNSPPEAPMTRGQIYRNLNNYHSDPMEISSRFWIPDITDWWRQQGETHSKYTDPSNVVRDIFSIIPHGVGMEDSFSLGGDVIGWRQSKTTSDTLCEKVIVRQFAQANNGSVEGPDSELDTTNTQIDSEMKNEAEVRNLVRMAKVYNCLEMWQGQPKHTCYP
jgi:hypothetical protein